MEQQQSDEQAKVRKVSKVSWKRMIVSFVIVMLLLMGAAWIAYDRMTDKLLEVLMDETMADLSSNSTNSGSLAEGSQEPANGGSSKTDEEVPMNTSKDPIQEQGSSNKTATATDEDAHYESSKASSRASSTDDSPGPSDSITGKGGGSKTVTEGGKRPNISEEEAEEAAGSVTISEKIEIGAVLLSHWDNEELKSFRAALSGGLTIEEKRELKKKAMEVLSEEEYDRLIGIAHKYGLSQGKSYKQSEQEEFPSR